MSLSGQKLLGLCVTIQPSESDKNHASSAAQLPPGARAAQNIASMAGNGNTGVGDPDSPIPHNRLYVGSLPFDLSKTDVTQIFEAIGPLEGVDLHVDPTTGRSKGFGFIQ